MKEKGSSFSGSIGFVLAAAGSAVGVGNIWRFPYLCAKDGGGLFLLVYLVLVLTFGFVLLTTGLLCGISSADLMPCAFKCVITLKPQEITEAFRHQLLFTKKDLKRWEQLNMLLIDNMEK